MPKPRVSVPAMNSGHGKAQLHWSDQQKRNQSQRWKPRGLGGSCGDVRGQSYTISDHRDFCQHK